MRPGLDVDSKLLKPEAVASGSAILSTIAAFLGLCCVGPVAVTLFGVAGAVSLARLEPLRPLFIFPACLLIIVTAIILYIHPLVTGRKITNSPGQHAFFLVSVALVTFAVFADELLGYLL